MYWQDFILLIQYTHSLKNIGINKMLSFNTITIKNKFNVTKTLNCAFYCSCQVV